MSFRHRLAFAQVELGLLPHHFLPLLLLSPADLPYTYEGGTCAAHPPRAVAASDRPAHPPPLVAYARPSFPANDDAAETGSATTGPQTPHTNLQEGRGRSPSMTSPRGALVRSHTASDMSTRRAATRPPSGAIDTATTGRSGPWTSPIIAASTSATPPSAAPVTAYSHKQPSAEPTATRPVAGATDAARMPPKRRPTTARGAA